MVPPRPVGRRLWKTVTFRQSTTFLLRGVIKPIGYRTIIPFSVLFLGKWTVNPKQKYEITLNREKEDEERKY